MAEPAAKRRTCTICGAEHNVGKACPDCGWDQEKEEALAKAERVRKELREKKDDDKPKRGIFGY
jgi:predicted  nucleic acid-binding Zn-ribbon protein